MKLACRKIINEPLWASGLQRPQANRTDPCRNSAEQKRLFTAVDDCSPGTLQKWRRNASAALCALYTHPEIRGGTRDQGYVYLQGFIQSCVSFEIARRSHGITASDTRLSVNSPAFPTTSKGTAQFDRATKETQRRVCAEKVHTARGRLLDFGTSAAMWVVLKITGLFWL